MAAKKKPAKKPAKKPVAVRKAVPRLEGEGIRDHGEVVTAPSGTSQEAVIDRLTGADKLPPIGEELGRKPSAPPFDPHEGHEVAPGREFGGEGEAMISTLVFLGLDRGGDFEDCIQQIVAAAESLGLKYVTASIAKLDLEQHLEHMTDIADQVLPGDDDDDEDEEKPERLDEEKF